MRIVYSSRAVESLKNIFQFLHRKSETAAATIQNGILDGIDRLQSFPEMAPIEPLLEDEPETFRSLVINRHYKAVYVIEDETIYIVDIWDCRQEPESLKKKTEEIIAK